MPNTIGMEPIDMPTAGFIYTINATKTATRIGKGCGKKGMNDKAKVMLAKVRMNAMSLNPLPSLASASFSFCTRLL